MKKVATILMIITCLMVGSMTIEAKKKSSKRSSNRTTTSKSYSPSGHKYKYYDNEGGYYTLEFNSYNNGGHYDMDMGYNYSYAHYRPYFTWTCSNNTVQIELESLIASSMTLKFSSDGRSLIDTRNNNVYRLIN